MAVSIVMVVKLWLYQFSAKINMSRKIQYFLGSTPVLWRKYSSTPVEVLRYFARSTGPLPRTSASVIPVGKLFVCIKLKLFGHVCTLQSLTYDSLLFRGENCIASASLKVSIATECGSQKIHEGVILGRVHPFLKSGESSGVGYRLVVPVERAGIIFAALVGVDKLKVSLFLHQCFQNKLVQAGGSQWTVISQAYGIPLGYVFIRSLWHGFNLCCL